MWRERKLWSYGFTLFTTFSLPEPQSQMSSIWNTDCFSSSPVICPSSPSCNCTAVLPSAPFVQPLPVLPISHKITHKTYVRACKREKETQQKHPGLLAAWSWNMYGAKNLFARSLSLDWSCGYRANLCSATVSSALLIFFRSIQKLSKKYELCLNSVRHREGGQGKWNLC